MTVTRLSGLYSTIKKMFKAYDFNIPSKRVMYAQGYCKVQVIIGSPTHGDDEWDGVSGIKYIGSRRTATLLINQAMKAALAGYMHKFNASPDYIYLDDYTFFYNYHDMQLRKGSSKTVAKVGKEERKAYIIPKALMFQELERPRTYKKKRQEGLRIKKSFTEEELQKMPSRMRERVSKKSRKHKAKAGKSKIRKHGWH